MILEVDRANRITDASDVVANICTVSVNSAERWNVDVLREHASARHRTLSD